MDDFFQSYLDTGLFDIGDNDDRLENLKAAVTDLQKKLAGNPSLIPHYTLVALDSNIPISDPVLLETEGILKEHWKLLRSKYADVPRNILRGIILTALYNVGKEDEISARIIYLAASQYYPFAKLGRERTMVQAMLVELSHIAENHASNEWLTDQGEPSVKLPTLKLAEFKFGEATFNSANLKSSLSTAAKRSSSGHNPYNHPEEWGEHFATNASAGVSKAIKESFTSFAASLKPDAIETPVNKFFAEAKKSIETALKGYFKSLTVIERRTKLLWWKEALYSTSQNKSYRSLDTDILPVVMPFDLVEQVPSITPVSLDYLLGDTLFVTISKVEQISIEELFQRLCSKRGMFTTYTNKLSVGASGRVSLVEFFILLVNEGIDVSEITNKTGIAGDEKIFVHEFAIMLLHELLIRKIINSLP